MPTLTIRDVPVKVVRSLKRQAKKNHRSMEQEVRTILEDRLRLAGERERRLAAMQRIEESWKQQKRPTTAKEVEEWIRQSRP